ncbi:MAG: hypothetical protein QXR45_08690 [Candidatus Bathyarchaeia archaeon]
MVLEGMLNYNIKLCHECPVKRVQTARSNFEKLQRKAEQEYSALKDCELCGERLWMLDDLKFCKKCEVVYFPLEIVRGEIEEKVCSVISSYEDACEDLCPIGYTECPLTSRKEDYYLYNIFTEEEVEKAK